MSRNFTQQQIDLLKGNVDVRTLVTFFFDSGTLYFAEDIKDVIWNGNSYVGAYGVADVEALDSGKDMVSEGIKIIVDGSRMTKAGIEDPGAIFSSVLDEPYMHRRVVIDFAFLPTNSNLVSFVVQAYVGRIVDMRVERPFSGDANLVISLESVESRYADILNRVRSDEDQQAIFPGDKFFSFTTEVLLNEGKLFWGKKGPKNHVGGSTGGGFGSGGGDRGTGHNFRLR